MFGCREDFFMLNKIMTFVFTSLKVKYGLRKSLRVPSLVKNGLVMVNFICELD
jgi:hypothetical protein